jgi:hypothetical protein
MGVLQLSKKSEIFPRDKRLAILLCVLMYSACKSIPCSVRRIYMCCRVKFVTGFCNLPSLTTVTTPSLLDLTKREPGVLNFSAIAILNPNLTATALAQPMSWACQGPTLTPGAQCQATQCEPITMPIPKEVLALPHQPMS